MKLVTPLARAKPLLAILSLILAPACADDPPPAAPPRAEAPAEDLPVLLFLGDSMAAGLGLPADQAFPAVLGERLAARGQRVRVINAGVSGDTSAGGLARLDWMLQQSPDLLVVELGGNDLLRGLPLADTEANLRAILRGAKERGVATLLLGVTAPQTHGPEAKAAFDALYPRLALEEGVPLVPDVFGALPGQHALLQADGLHPTAEGHQRIADAVEPALAEALSALVLP